VFEMFSQGAAPADLTDKGLGIGLAVARDLVRMHGGTLVAESDGVGHGARFVVRLPLARSAPAESVVPEPVAPPQVPPRRVLVVDDNVDAADSLAMLLGLQGHRVEAVHSGEAAVRAVSRAPPEVVLLDLGMPDMDGYEVARRLRALPAGASLTLVALTGWGQAEDRRRTRAAGFDDHLTKPVDAARLDEILMRPHREARALSSVETPSGAH
jgi:CheY-like chemotaxis protein